MSKFYLTTPIYYPNARPHVGSAYTTIVCDVIARYKRMCGYDVAFVTGTDEHGEKLERAAVQAGVTPREFVAEKRELFRQLWRALGISDYRFVYTDQPDHVVSVQKLLVRARTAGYIYKGHYQGRYCVHCEMYISEGSEPVDCPNCGRPAELISEHNYFFKLSAFQDRLLELYDQQPDFIQPDFRRNEMISFVKSGLRDISVSRSRIKWGIPWPDDPEQVFYVWYDALTAYLTGIGFAEGENGSAAFQEYWPADLHVIGKDILRFHTVYWPAFLWAAGMELPKSVFAHGWLYYEQDKMSKSKGNVIYPEPIVHALNSFGAPGNDALRYYLLREAPFGQDMSFSYEALIQRSNSDLANDLGNLASRTVTMLHRYFGGELPGPAVDWETVTALSRAQTPQEVNNAHQMIARVASADWMFIVDSRTQEITELSDQLRTAFQNRFEERSFDDALADFWGFVGEVNKYLVENAPWKLAEAGLEANQTRIATVLCTAAEALRFIAVLVTPVMPDSAQRLWNQLGGEGEVKNQRVDQLQWGGLKPGTRIGKPEPVFPRLDKAVTLRKLEELAEADRERDRHKETVTVLSEMQGVPKAESAVPTPEPRIPTPDPGASPRITIDDFAKVDLRVGEVLSAEPIPGAKKLLKLMIDIGTEVRQVCAGIAEHYQPEQLVGMKIVLVANLQPRKLRGIESNGMIVAASLGENGRPVLATFNEDVPKGARLK